MGSIVTKHSQVSDSMDYGEDGSMGEEESTREGSEETAKEGCDEMDGECEDLACLGNFLTIPSKMGGSYISIRPQNENIGWESSQLLGHLHFILLLPSVHCLACIDSHRTLVAPSADPLAFFLTETTRRTGSRTNVISKPRQKFNCRLM